MSNEKKDKNQKDTARPVDAPLYQKLTVPKKKTNQSPRRRQAPHSAVPMGRETEQMITRCEEPG